MEFTRLNIKGMMGVSIVSKGANYTLQENEKAAVIALAATASSKTFTLDLPDYTVAIVVNVGVNAFTLKNVSGDSGTSIAGGKVYLIFASRTANDSALYLLNDTAADPA